MRSVELDQAQFRLDSMPFAEYAPTMTGTGTNPTPTAINGQFRRNGTDAFVQGQATMSATLGTGEYRVSLPSGWTAATHTAGYWEGGGVLIDTSAGLGYSIKPIVSSAGTIIRLVWVNGSALQQSVTVASPFAFASTDTLSWHLWLELAV